MDLQTGKHLVERLGHRFNPWWDGVPPITGVPRDTLGAARGALSADQALAIVGLRQSGKSTLMRQLVADLIESGTPPQDIFFVNFDEPMLTSHLGDPLALDALVDAYRADRRPTGRPYVFLDEVQNLDHWAGWVRTMVETRACTVVLSGSSSRLIEPVLGAALTGRTRRLAFGPFSFAEYLRATRTPPGDDLHMNTALLGYLERGGLPAAVLERDAASARTRLTQYFDDILSRDIVARHGVRSVRTLHEVALHFLEQTARPFTFQRLKGLFAISLDQARNYTAHLADAHLLGELERYDQRPGARLRAPRKGYARDTGLRNAVVARFSEDLGWLAETAVHNAIAAAWHDRCFYFGGEQVAECDFVLFAGTTPVAAIQVCFTPGSLPERERRGLLGAMEALDLPTGLILTGDRHDDETVAGRVVRYRPLWRWLLDPGPDMAGAP